VKPGVAEKLEAYTAAGGILVVTYFSGIVDEYDRVHLGGYPAPLRRLLGLTVDEWAVPPDDRGNTLCMSDMEGLSASYACSFWAEVVRPEGAEVLATFEKDFYAGKPAITRHTFGRGEAWYLATELEAGFYEDLIHMLASRAGLKPVLDVPANVEVCERSGDGKRFLFLLNHNAEPVALHLGGLHGRELLTNLPATENWTLAPYGVAIFSLTP
jgi:beta-galactosidase